MQIHMVISSDVARGPRESARLGWLGGFEVGAHFNDDGGELLDRKLSLKQRRHVGALSLGRNGNSDFFHGLGLFQKFRSYPAFDRASGHAILLWCGVWCGDGMDHKYTGPQNQEFFVAPQTSCIILDMETKNSHGGAGRGQGRKPTSPDGEVMQIRKFRASDAEWQKCQDLARENDQTAAQWIRDRINEAPDPAPERKPRRAKPPRIDE